MKNKKSGLANSVLIWLLQLFGEGSFIYSLIKLDILPTRFLIPVIGLMGVMLLLTFLLLFVGRSKKKAKQVVRQILALIIAVIMLICSVLGYLLLTKITRTIDSSTGIVPGGTTVGVYVLKEDAAQTLDDAKDYTFGRSTTYDVEHTDKMVEHINSKLDKEIQLKDYELVPDQVLGLYNKEVGAIILNPAYVAVLEQDISSGDGENTEENVSFTDFSDRTRLLYEYDITTPKDTAVVEEETDFSITKDPFIVYISGSDTREKMLTVSRSDVNILAVVNPQTRQVLLLNTPRDYYVETSVSGGARDKLTHCGIYGVDCSKDTLSMLYQKEIRYFAQINFTGFEQLIDAFGGVTIHSDVEFKIRNDRQIVVGDNELNGEDALAFVRERYALAGGDNARGQNQMKVIKALMDKVSAGTLASHYSEILDSIAGMFITDMETTDLLKLVKLQITQGGKWNVKSYAVTGFDSSNYTYSMPKTLLYVMEPNMESVDKAIRLIDAVYEGKLLSDYELAME